MKFVFKISLILIQIIALCVTTFSVSAVENLEKNTAVAVKESNLLEQQILDEKFSPIEENENLALYVDVNSGNFAVLDKNGGQIWYAYSPDIEKTELIPSFSESLQSLLNITYSFDSGEPMTVGTYSNDGSTSIELFKKNKGIRFCFYYSKNGAEFSVPLLITLEKEYFYCEIDYSNITEGENVQIIQLSPLPNFGTAKVDEQGYALIPDGSGALIYNSSIKSRDIKYQETVYGDDPLQGLTNSASELSHAVRMPIFGFVRSQGACLTVIHKGDSSALINVSAQYDYLTCGASFVYRESDLTGIQTKDYDTRVFTVIQDKVSKINPISRYYLISGDDADYSGMARVYREYLIKEKGISRLSDTFTAPMTFEAFGGVLKKGSFLGIPIKKLVKVTTFNQIKELQSELEKAGISQSKWILNGFLKGGYENKQHTLAKYEGKLGGKKGYNSTIDLLGKENVFTVYDSIHRYGSANSWFNMNADAKSLNQLTGKRYYKKLSTGLINDAFGMWTYRNLHSLEDLTSKIIKNAPKNSGVSFAYMGQELYNDFTTDKSVTRSNTMLQYKKIMSKATNKGLKTASDGANVYMASVTDFMYGVPITSNNHLIESESIPFYTMVLHGYVSMASQQINDHADANTYCLQAFEQGISVMCRVAGVNSYELNDTKLNFLYNSSFDNALEIAKLPVIQDYVDVHSTLYNQAITEHSRQEDLSITTYENGWRIVVNYGEKASQYEGESIEPNSYKVLR